MTLTGYVLRRDDTNEYWGKGNGWTNIPYIYTKTPYVKNAAHCHCDYKNTVRIPYSILTVNIEINDGDILFSKAEGDNCLNV